MNENRTRLDSIVGLIAAGASVTGVVGLVAGIVAFFSRELTAAGICLIAAALSFGLLANAVLRE